MRIKCVGPHIIKFQIPRYWREGGGLPTGGTLLATALLWADEIRPAARYDTRGTCKAWSLASRARTRTFKSKRTKAAGDRAPSLHQIVAIQSSSKSTYPRTQRLSSNCYRHDQISQRRVLRPHRRRPYVAWKKSKGSNRCIRLLGLVVCARQRGISWACTFPMRVVLLPLSLCLLLALSHTPPHSSP